MPSLSRPTLHGVIGGTFVALAPRLIGWDWSLALVAGFVLLVGWARRGS